LRSWLGFREDLGNCHLKLGCIFGLANYSLPDSSVSSPPGIVVFFADDSDSSTMPPFDRHDWIVTRPYPPPSSIAVPTLPQDTTVNPSTTSLTTRYVIDYYSAPPDDEGNPVFHLDVRPALDDLESINLRIKVGLEEWMKGDRS